MRAQGAALAAPDSGTGWREVPAGNLRCLFPYAQGGGNTNLHFLRPGRARRRIWDAREDTVMKPQTWWQQSVHNKLIALILAMVVLVPLVATPADHSIRGAAALAFEGFGITLLAMLLWRSEGNVSVAKVKTFLTTGANLPILLFLGLAALSCALSPHKAYSEQELLRVGTGIVLYFVVANQFRRSDMLAKLVDALMFVTIGTGLIGIAQFAATRSQHATGMFGDHQLFGSFLMILLPVVAVVAITEKNPNRQLVAQAATVLATTCLLLTQARSAWIGTAAGLATLGVLALVAAHANGSKTVVQKHQVVMPIVLLVVAAGFFLLILPQSNVLLTRATSLQGGAAVNTWAIRQHTWRGAMQMIGQRPLTGFGLGLYPYYQKAYTNDGMAISRIGGAASLGEQAHNFYLQTAAELGLPGLLLIAASLVTFLVAGVRRVGQMDAGLRRSLLMGSMASVVAFGVDAYASPSWQCGQVSMFLWLILGLGAAAMRPNVSQRSARTAVSMDSLRRGVLPEAAVIAQPRRSPRLTRALSVAGALLLILLLPTVVLAVGNLYATPQSARVTPPNATIRGGSSQPFNLLVTFSDGIERDVTLDMGSGIGTSQSVFSQTGGTGFMTGPNSHIYQSLSREKNTTGVTIMGTYTQTADPTQHDAQGHPQVSGRVSATTTLFLRFP